MFSRHQTFLFYVRVCSILTSCKFWHILTPSLPLVMNHHEIQLTHVPNPNSYIMRTVRNMWQYHEKLKENMCNYSAYHLQRMWQNKILFSECFLFHSFRKSPPTNSATNCQNVWILPFLLVRFVIFEWLLWRKLFPEHLINYVVITFLHKFCNPENIYSASTPSDIAFCLNISNLPIFSTFTLLGDHALVTRNCHTFWSKMF